MDANFGAMDELWNQMRRFKDILLTAPLDQHCGYTRHLCIFGGLGMVGFFVVVIFLAINCFSTMVCDLWMAIVMFMCGIVGSYLSILGMCFYGCTCEQQQLV